MRDRPEAQGALPKRVGLPLFISNKTEERRCAMNKTKMLSGKRLLAMLLCCLMVLALVPVQAQAYTAEVGVPYFDFSYESDGTEIMYHNSFELGGYTAGDSSGNSHRVRIWINEEEAWCIEPGHHLLLGDELRLNASDCWERLSEDVKNGILTVLAFGRPGNKDRIGGSDGSQTVATQLLIWEMVCGARNPVTFERYDECILNCICQDGHHPEVRQVYDTIVSFMQSYKTMPSFADGTEQSLAFENGKYTLSLTDTNGVLSDCTVEVSDSAVEVTRSGNVLTLSCNESLSGSVTVTLTKTSGISANAQLVTYGDPNLQDVIVGIAKPEDVKASFSVSTGGGNMNLIKTSEDGVVEGISLTVTGEGIQKTVKTGPDGTILIEDLAPGEYTVTELTGEQYLPQNPQVVTVVSGQTVNVSFDNVLKRGSLSVVKNAEDSFMSGMRFHLYGTAACGLPVDAYATTDENGVATFTDILISGEEGYSLEEVDTAVRYVTPDIQNVRVFWNETVNAEMSNVLKKFNVIILKQDAEHGSSRGTATLAGAVYGLFRGDELVEQMVTDADGYAVSGYYVCGDDWTVREITPPEGYALDETVYEVGASPTLYAVEYSTANTINVYEQPLKGQIAIIKHHDNGETQIETPEEGAQFQVFLSSAGSFDLAEEAERDTLICDADGFAISKELPYGEYTVHQTVGFPDTEFMPDFTVYIAKPEVYKFLINNAAFTAFLKVVKADAETGESIPLSGAAFQIYDANGELVRMQCSYPSLQEMDTFYVSGDGSLCTPQVLPVGDYSLVEVQAPYGYVLDSTPTPFSVTRETAEEEGTVTLVTVTVYDAPQKARLQVIKTGEMFSTVYATGETDTAPTIFRPVFETLPLEGAAFRVSAAEDIRTGDGTLRYAAGEVVDEITTGEDGIALTKELYLGRYLLTETQVPEGFTASEEPMEVVLSYADQTETVTIQPLNCVNERQRMALDARKQMETSPVYGVGTGSEVTAVTFGLYAGEELTARDGSTIPADGMLEIVRADEEGHVAFRSDLPFGEYYVKELSTAAQYRLDETVYRFSFRPNGESPELSTFTLNDGEPIVNALRLGRIEGSKVDPKGEPLAGAVFGIFPAGAEDYADDKVLQIVASDASGHFAFEQVPLGDYVVVELEAPASYLCTQQVYPVSLTEDGETISLTVENLPITGSIELTKVDEEYPENHMTGAEFALYEDTDGDGILNVETDRLVGTIPEVNTGIYRADELPFGSYFVQETKAPVGFLRDEIIYAVTIREDGKTVTVENEPGVGFMNVPVRGSVSVFKTDKASGEKLIGAGFRLFDADGQQLAEAVTGESGMVSFENLRYGAYSIREYAAPEGYVLDDTPLRFEITEQGQSQSFDMENLRIMGKFRITKADADDEHLLPDTEFKIYDVEGKVVKEGKTDAKGISEFELPFGKYYYQETKAPAGYLIDDTKYEFSIREDGSVVSVVMLNEKEEPEPTPTPKPTSTPAPTPKPTSKPTPTPAPTAKPSTDQKGPTVKTDSPKTGDTSNVKLWTAVAALAGAGGLTVLGLVQYYDRRRKKGNGR